LPAACKSLALFSSSTLRQATSGSERRSAFDGLRTLSAGTCLAKTSSVELCRLREKGQNGGRMLSKPDDMVVPEEWRLLRAHYGYTYLPTRCP
jgi:hypothetical protein